MAMTLDPYYRPNLGCPHPTEAVATAPNRPAVGEVWWVKLSDQVELSALKVDALTRRVVILSSRPTGLYNGVKGAAYKIENVEFVERFTDAAF